MSTTILKEYDQKKLEDLCKEYKYLSIYDVNNKKIQPYNQQGVPIKEHFKICIKRLNSEAVPEGYYYFCFANSLRQSNSPDKFIYRKGNVSADALSDNQKFIFPNGSNKNDLLSVQSALAYITQIAELKTENNRLTMENKQLLDENTVLKAELAEADRSADAEEEGVGEGDGSLADVKSFLNDQSPTIINFMDRYFELQEKKLNLQEKIHVNGSGKAQHKRNIKKIEPGSAEHLNLIRTLYKNNDDDRMNKELDVLEEKNPEAYELICNELDIQDDGQEQGE